MKKDDHEKFLKEFEKDVKWLRNNIPPDDIYDFCQEALMAANFFLSKLMQLNDLEEELENDKVLSIYYKNIVAIKIGQKLGLTTIVNTMFKDINEL